MRSRYSTPVLDMRHAASNVGKSDLADRLRTCAPVRRLPKPYIVRPSRCIISIGANEPSLNTYVYIKSGRVYMLYVTSYAHAPEHFPVSQISHQTVY